MKMLAILVFSLLIVGCAHTGIIVKEFKPEQIIHYITANFKTWEKIQS
jgi:hypothetical protein